MVVWMEILIFAVFLKLSKTFKDEEDFDFAGAFVHVGVLFRAVRP